MDTQFLELIFLSGKRKKLLLFLKEGPKTIAEIKRHLDVGAMGILSQLKRLRENSPVIKKGDVHSLSSFDIAIAGRMQSMVDLLSFLELNMITGQVMQSSAYLLLYWKESENYPAVHFPNLRTELASLNPTKIG